MVDPTGIVSGFGQGFASGIGKLMFYMGYMLISLVILGFFIGLYFLLQYKYKIVILERRGIGQGKGKGKPEENEGLDVEGHTIGKIRKERARELKVNGIEKWKLLMTRKLIAPVNYSHIYPGNNIFLYRTGKDNFIPVDFTAGNDKGLFSPIPQSIKVWQQLEIQQAMQEYQKESLWNQYGPVLLTVGTILFCLVLCGVTVWYSYNHANQVAVALARVSGAVGNINVIPGVPPG